MLVVDPVRDFLKNDPCFENLLSNSEPVLFTEAEFTVILL